MGFGQEEKRQQQSSAIEGERLEAESECPSFRAKIMMITSRGFPGFLQSFCVEGNESATSYACVGPAWTRGSAGNEKT